MSFLRPGPITINPYRRTVFRIAMMPREVVDRAAIVGYLAEARDIAGLAPDSNRILGEPVTLEEINDAESVLLKAGERIGHELLAHATERLNLDRVRQLETDVSTAIAQCAAADLTARRRALTPILLDFMRTYLDREAASQPWIGALEMDLAPPFGGAERE